MTNEDLLELVPIDFGGGSGLSKANLMYYLIRTFKIKASVDIGVYRGRSLLPQALAHLQHTGGIAYGVDPYDNELAKEKDNHELRKQIDKFIDENDFNKIYKDVSRLLKKTNLNDNTELVRKTSADAVSYFQKNAITPRLIHIDGNHDTKRVVEDVKNYTKLLGEDGFIIMDDVSWGSVKPAVDLLSNHPDFQLVFCKVTSLNDYAVFSNIPSVRKNQKLAGRLFTFGQYD